MSMFNGGSRSDRPEADAAHPPRNPFARSQSGDMPGAGSESQAIDSIRPFGGSGPTPPDKCENVLASGAKWKGSLSVDTSVRVDGHFSGQIDSKSTVHVAEGSLVDGKIRAAFVVLAGVFRGEILCDQRVDLLPHSRVEAEINTRVLGVQEGAVFDGHIQMTSSDQRAGRAKPAAETDAGERRRDRQLAGAVTDSNGSAASDLE